MRVTKRERERESESEQEGERVRERPGRPLQRLLQLNKFRTIQGGREGGRERKEREGDGDRDQPETPQRLLQLHPTPRRPRRRRRRRGALRRRRLGHRRVRAPPPVRRVHQGCRGGIRIFTFVVHDFELVHVILCAIFDFAAASASRRRSAMSSRAVGVRHIEHI
jgi:hypothetical protein